MNFKKRWNPALAKLTRFKTNSKIKNQTIYLLLMLTKMNKKMKTKILIRSPKNQSQSNSLKRTPNLSMWL